MLCRRGQEEACSLLAWLGFAFVFRNSGTVGLGQVTGVGSRPAVLAWSLGLVETPNDACAFFG